MLHHRPAALHTPQPDGSSQALLLSDTCTIKSDGGAAKRCQLTAWGTIQADGSGVAKAVLTSGDRVIVFDETFTSTGPTANPNVLLDWGTITVTH